MLIVGVALLVAEAVASGGELTVLLLLSALSKYVFMNIEIISIVCYCDLQKSTKTIFKDKITMKPFITKYCLLVTGTLLHVVLQKYFL